MNRGRSTIRLRLMLYLHAAARPSATSSRKAGVPKRQALLPPQEAHGCEDLSEICREARQYENALMHCKQLELRTP